MTVHNFHLVYDCKFLGIFHSLDSHTRRKDSWDSLMGTCMSIYFELGKYTSPDQIRNQLYTKLDFGPSLSQKLQIFLLVMSFFLFSRIYDESTHTISDQPWCCLECPSSCDRCWQRTIMKQRVLYQLCALLCFWYNCKEIFEINCLILTFFGY